MRGGALKKNRCIKNLLKFINVLQKNSVDCRNDDNSCTKPYLGMQINNFCYNTRVITLYNCQGTLITTTFNSNGVSSVSSTFRIQDIHDDCCTLLILNEENGTYYSTGQYITVSLNCICAVKCLGDVHINCL